MTAPTAANDAATITRLVEQAVRAAVPPADIVERPVWPGAASSWPQPTPMAGFRAAQQVARLAEAQVHKYAKELRGEGVSWRELADLMDIPWSDDWSRPERAFELVAGPDDGSAWSSGPSVYWHCGGPAGCGKHIVDRGPYNGHPRDDEDGHDDGCRRLAAEIDAHAKAWEERDRLNAVMDEAYAQLPEHSFARGTADRARWVQAHGGQYRPWSTTETLAVALVLDDKERLKGWSRARAIERVGRGMGPDPEAWLALVRAAATGERT